MHSNFLLLSKWLQFLRERNFKQTIPPVKIEEGEEITYEKATSALRRAAHFFEALQSNDGHWPAENAGPLYFLPPFVSCIIIIILWLSHNEIDFAFVNIYINMQNIYW